MVELWKNYWPHVPKKYRKNILYAKPDAKILSLVKEERSTRSVFRAKLKEAKAAGTKARLESIAFLDDNGNNDITAEYGEIIDNTEDKVAEVEEGDSCDEDDEETIVEVNRG